jgi:hypothetical protein
VVEKTKQTPPAEIQSPAVRSFLRALNILLKSARMYGMAHAQTIAQSSEAWEHLHAALSDRRKAGLQLAVSEGRLLVDGIPVKAGPAEQSFAQMLTAGDLASITFTPQATTEALTEMVRVFAETGAKPEGLAKKLKETLSEETKKGIRINEVRFVPAGSEQTESKITAEILAQTLGSDSGQVQGVLDDPRKLLQLITAAEGAGHEAGYGLGPGPGPGPGSPSGPGIGLGPGGGGGSPSATGPTEDETTSVIRLLSRLAREGGSDGTVDTARFRQEFAQLPQTSQAKLQQALVEVSETMPKKEAGAPLLLQVAEHLAIRLAMDRYERGDSRVDAVKSMLERMNQEIQSLRDTVGSYEEKLKEAGFELSHPADALEQEFWARTPESSKLKVLLSEDAWQIPSKYVRQFVEELIERDEVDKLQKILLSYLSCIHSSSVEARQRVAAGLKDLAEFYPRPGGEMLRTAILHVGDQLAKEDDQDLQKLMGATFVLLGQEAATRRRYPAVLQMLSTLQAMDGSHPDVASSLRARIGLENRIPDFLEEALRMPEVSGELRDLLQRLPVVAAEHIAGRISRSARRRERDRLIKLAQELGPSAGGALRDAFRTRTPAAAVIMVGLLSQMDPASTEEVLRARLHEWSRAYHDAAVRQIAAAHSPGRGRLLARLLNALDPLTLPMAIDEIGMSDDSAPAPLLMGIARGEAPGLSAPYLRLKAVEALGRLHVKEAVPVLRRMVDPDESRQMELHREIQIAAAQSLQRIDPEGGKAIVSSAGFKQADLEPMASARSDETPGVRQRFYPRTKLSRALSAKASTSEGEYSVQIRELSLSGGLCSCEQHFSSGTPAVIRIKTGIRSITLKTLLRDARSNQTAFEIVDIDLDERAKLRSLLQAARR